MITFSDVRRNKTINTFCIPEPLKTYVMDDIEKAGIPCRSVTWRNLPKELYIQREEARERYKNAGYIDYHCIGAIISDIHPDDLFQKSLLYFGDTIDPDYKKVMDEARQLSHEDAMSAVEEMKRQYPDEWKE